MSSIGTARQNRIRLIAVFLFTVLLVLTLQVYQGFHHAKPAEAASQGNATPLDPSLFMGLRHASAKEIQSVLPEAAHKPVLLAFTSKLCHDCQRMTPVLQQFSNQHPQVYFRKIDVLTDAQTFPAILRTFKPVSVPVLVFISPTGEIRNVLYNYQSPEVLARNLQALAPTEGSPPAASPHTPPKALKSR